MLSSSRPTNQINRARPLLGTLVAIRAGGLAEGDANRIVDGGFARIAEIHALMSFHEESSDLSRLNRMAVDGPVTVHPRCFEVLRIALSLAADSAGIFDITIAGQLVEWGYLPRPAQARLPDSIASWRDIELIAPDMVRFHRPLWIDLGGIAKGYAVDCAIQYMMAATPAQYLVNAGGDIRVAGPAQERIVLNVPPGADGAIPAFDLENGSIASSSGRDTAKRMNDHMIGPHVHGVRRNAIGSRSFVSVIAERCVIADALTKIVMALGPRSARILRKYDATAYVHRGTKGGYFVS